MDSGREGCPFRGLESCWCRDFKYSPITYRQTCCLFGKPHVQRKIRDILTFHYIIWWMVIYYAHPLIFSQNFDIYIYELMNLFCRIDFYLLIQSYGGESDCYSYPLCLGQSYLHPFGSSCSRRAWVFQNPYENFRSSKIHMNILGPPPELRWKSWVCPQNPTIYLGLPHSKENPWSATAHRHVIYSSSGVIYEAFAVTCIKKERISYDDTIIFFFLKNRTFLGFQNHQ